MYYAKKIGVKLMIYEQQDQHYVLLIQSPSPDHGTFSHDLHWVQITFSELDSGMTRISANVQEVILRVATCGVRGRALRSRLACDRNDILVSTPRKYSPQNERTCRTCSIKRSTGLKAHYITSSHRRLFNFMCFQTVIFIY